MLKLIVCVDSNNGIGLNNKLPWNIKSEMQHFKNTTINHTVVMGRKTYESIGRLLPNRNNIILSNNVDYKVDGALVTNNIQEIIDLSKTREVFIIGGKSIYDIFLNYCDELIISKLFTSYECDTFIKFNLRFFELEQTIKQDEFEINYYKSMGDKILFGSKVVNKIKNELLAKKDFLLKQYKVVPQLAIIQFNDDFASNVYIRNKIKLGKELGIIVNHIQLTNSTQEELISEIHKLNDDINVHGILIQLPLPKEIDTNIIFRNISPTKDVDCFHPENVGQLWTQPFFDNKPLPCTPYGIIKLLDFYKIDLVSKNITIVGRSNIVGKPLASLLLYRNATVKICHSKTKDLIEQCKWADILVVSIGQPKLINSKHVKDGTIVIDVGINRDDKNKLCGDVDFDDVITKVKSITPVPFGIGPITLIMLFNNLLNAYLKCMQML